MCSSMSWSLACACVSCLPPPRLATGKRFHKLAAVERLHGLVAIVRLRALAVDVRLHELVADVHVRDLRCVVDEPKREFDAVVHRVCSTDSAASIGTSTPSANPYSNKGGG